MLISQSIPSHTAMARSESSRTKPWTDGSLFPASGGDACHYSYWHYQFATNPESRRYLYEKSQEYWWGYNLSGREVDWIMSQEKDMTTLMKRMKDPASGGWMWFIRQGNVVTLAEVFWMGSSILPC